MASEEFTLAPDHPLDTYDAAAYRSGMNNEPLNIQLAREWLAAIDNGTILPDGRFMPKIGDAKPMDFCEAMASGQRAIDEIIAAGFRPYP